MPKVREKMSARRKQNGKERVVLGCGDAAHPQVGHVPEATPIGTFRVLHLEDNPGDAFLVRSLLSYEGKTAYEVTHVTRVADFLALVSSAYDVAMIDLDLPDSRGAETLERVLPYVGVLPIVVVSGHDEACFREAASVLGFEGFVCKAHLSPECITRAVSQAIGRHHRRPARASHELRPVSTSDAKPKSHSSGSQGLTPRQRLEAILPARLKLVVDA